MALKNTFHPPAIGDSIVFRKTMTVAEQAMFTGISGNLGGLYVNRRNAREEGLQDAAVFELAAAALWTTCLARLAGDGHRIARIESTFHAPVTVGATLEARATLVKDDSGELTFDLALDADDEPAATGHAVLQAIKGG